jgi:hypothetical protein
MADCAQKEKEWMDKLKEASDVYGEMLEADKEVMQTYEEAKNVLYAVWAEIFILGRHGETVLGAELGLAGLIIEGFEKEEHLKELAAEQQERDEEYQELLKEVDELLEALCECEREE